MRDRSTESNGTLDERLYSLKDQLDPVAVCDDEGEVVERYAYSAFGLTTVLDAEFEPLVASTVVWSFLFHGEFMDVETAWYNYGYRYYPAELGRWLSRDPKNDVRSPTDFAICSNDMPNLFDRWGANIDFRILDVVYYNNSSFYKASGGHLGETHGSASSRFALQAQNYLETLASDEIPTPTDSDRCRQASAPTFTIAVYAQIHTPAAGTVIGGSVVTQEVADRVLGHEQGHVNVSKALADNIWKRFHDFINNYKSEKFCTRAEAVAALKSDFEIALRRTLDAHSSTLKPIGDAHKASGTARHDANQWRWAGGDNGNWEMSAVSAIESAGEKLKFEKSPGNCPR